MSPRDRAHYRVLGDRLWQLRVREGWSAEECAVQAGVSRRTWEYFEAGETVPQAATLSMMFRVFGWQLRIRVVSPKNQNEACGTEIPASEAAGA